MTDRQTLLIQKSVPTEQLYKEVWRPEYTGENEHVKHYVWALRKFNLT